MVKGVVNDSSHEITKIYHDGREIERVCDIYGNVLYLSSKTVTGAASLSFKNRKESTRNVVGFSVETSSSDIESINAFMLSKLFIVKQISTSYFGVYLPEPGSYEITLVYTGQTYNFVSDGDVNTYLFIDLGYGAVVNRDIDIYVEKQDGQFDFTKVKYAIFDTIYYDDRYDILNEHPVRFDNSIESYSIYGNNLNGVHVGDYDENSGKYMLPISIHGKNLFNVEDFFSSSINVVRGNMRFYEQTQEHVVGVLIQAENNDCYTMPYYQIPCKPGQYYTLSWYSDNNNPGLVYIFFYDSDGIEISQVHANNANSKQLTFLVPENAASTKMRLGVANAGDNIAYTNIQLERGQTKTNYISYQDPVVHTVSLDEPLRKIGNELEYIQKRKSGTNGILHRVTQKTSNTAPLTFASTGQALKNYRIYGNTINGENVGDRTGNICTNIWSHGVINDMGVVISSSTTVCSDFIAVTPNVIYSLTRTVGTNYNNLRCFDINKNYLGNGITCADKANPVSANETFGTFMITDQNVAFIRFNDASNSIETKYMMVEGTYTEQTMPAYEPYGYRVPVTVTNGTGTQTKSLYLPEQIKMVGDEAEYVDYQEQKLHRVRKNLLKNTATSQTINGLTFTVNTDGSVTCNGRREQTSTFFTIGSVTTSGEIILSGCPSGGSSASFTMRAFSATVSKPRIYYDIGDGCMLNTPDTYNIDIRIQSDYDCDNLTFYPMIRKADIEDDTYEPYIENTELDAELPELQTVEGTNTLSIRTSVQPSQVLVEAMYPNDSYILAPEISTFEDINTITVNTEIPPESISITGKIGPIS